MPRVGCVGRVLPLAAVAAMWLSLSAAQDMSREPAWYASMLRSRAATARQYAFDAVIEMARKTGDGPREALAPFKVKVAVAPDRRYLFWLGDKSDLRYLVVSDGRRTWGYIPAENRYAEFDAVLSPVFADLDRAFASGLSKDDVDPVLSSSLIFPILSRLAADGAVVDMRWPGASEFDSEREPPVLTILAGKPEDANQKLTELTLDPDTLDIAQLNWTRSVLLDDEPVFTQLSASFSRFEVGKPIPESHFVFMPGGAQRVETLPVPGMDGTRIEGKPAPEFQIELADGRKVKSADLRGRAVILAFSAADCEPCARQSKVLASLDSGGKYRSVVLLEAGGANAELHTLFGIRLVPSLVVIDKAGVVARLLPGRRDPDAIRAVLNQTGY